MNIEPFEYAKDAILRFDHVGYSDWSFRKREALSRLTFAQDAYELELKKTKNRAMAKATLAMLLFNAACFYVYSFNTGAL